MSVRVDNMITAERRRRGGRHINSGTILVQIHLYSLRPMAGHYYLLLYIALQLARSCGGDCGPFTKCRWREQPGGRPPLQLSCLQRPVRPPAALPLHVRVRRAVRAVQRLLRGLRACLRAPADLRPARRAHQHPVHLPR